MCPGAIQTAPGANWPSRALPGGRNPQKGSPFLGPFWAKRGPKIEDVFMTWFLTPWSAPERVRTLLGPQKASKNGTQNRLKRRISRSQLLLLFTTLWPHSGVLKIIIFWYFFGTPFWELWEPILLIFTHFWGPLWRPFW